MENKLFRYIVNLEVHMAHVKLPRYSTHKALSNLVEHFLVCLQY